MLQRLYAFTLEKTDIIQKKNAAGFGKRFFLVFGGFFSFVVGFLFVWFFVFVRVFFWIFGLFGFVCSFVCYVLFQFLK